jgi:hypothetical protein
VPGAVDPHTCSHEALELGFDHLGGPARQCPGCGVWFIEEYEESFDGEEENCWFSLVEVPAPQTET